MSLRATQYAHDFLANNCPCHCQDQKSITTLPIPPSLADLESCHTEYRLFSYGPRCSTGHSGPSTVPREPAFPDVISPHNPQIASSAGPTAGSCKDEGASCVHLVLRSLRTDGPAADCTAQVPRTDHQLRHSVISSPNERAAAAAAAAAAATYFSAYSCHLPWPSGTVKKPRNSKLKLRMASSLILRPFSTRAAGRRHSGIHLALPIRPTRPDRGRHPPRTVRLVCPPIAMVS